jgi:hypothetical protein
VAEPKQIGPNPWEGTDYQALVDQLKDAGFSYRIVFFKDHTWEIETFFGPEGKIETEDRQRWLFDEKGALIAES